MYPSPSRAVSVATRPGLSSSLGSVGKWFAGVIVVALVGALVGILVPRMFGPPELGATLSRVAIQANVTLDEYKIRQAGSGRSGGDQAAARGAGGPLLISAQVDPVATDTTSQETTSTNRQQETTDDQDTTTTDDQGTTTTDAGRSQGGGGDAVIQTELKEKELVDLRDGVAQAARSLPAPVDLSPDCLENAISDSCGLNSVATALDVAESGEVSKATVARELARVFKGTRTVPSQTNPGERELVGASVDFNLALTGFKGSTVFVRWSLYSARQGVRVPGPWHFN